MRLLAAFLFSAYVCLLHHYCSMTVPHLSFVLSAVVVRAQVTGVVDTLSTPIHPSIITIVAATVI